MILFSTSRTTARFAGRSLLSACHVSRRSRSELVGLAIAEECQSLGGAFAKFGQILSTRVDLFPPAALVHLTQLQDRMRPISGRRIRPVVEANLGCPLDDVFLEFGDDPVASGTVACVYPARLTEGALVAVKVRRPGVAQAVQADVKLLKFLAILASHAPWMRLVPIAETIDEICTSIINQLDFEMEAANNRRFQAMIADRPKLRMPHLVDRYCTKSMLVMEFAEGLTRVEQLPGAVEQYRPAMLAALRALYRMIFNEGFVHCDLHPGNIFFGPAGHVVILDTGFVAQISPSTRHDFSEFFFGVVTGSSGRCSEVIIRNASRIAPEFDKSAFECALEEVIAATSGKMADQFSVMGFVVSLFDLQRRFGVRSSPDFTSAILSLLIFEGVVKQMYPDLDFQGEAKPFVISELMPSISPTERAGTPRELAMNAPPPPRPSNAAPVT